MDDQSAIILVLDASVLINFLAVDRVDLIQAHPAKILLTEHVREEVTRFYPEQVARLDAAISAGIMEVFVIDDPNEIEEMNTLRSKWGEKRLGVGECSAIVAAKRRGYEIAIDDERAIKTIAVLKPPLKIHRTQDMMVRLIYEGALSIAEADGVKEEWSTKYRFVLKFGSFAEIME